jgi:hypothetical protein
MVDSEERATIVGTLHMKTSNIIRVGNDGGSLTIDVSKARRVAKATEEQLLPTGAQSIQGKEFDEHLWIQLSSGANFLIGKKKK